MVADARQRMVQSAARLFRRHGYHAVGFRRIIDESGAPRGSIYHHFPGGKEQLGVEAVRFSGAALIRQVRRVAGEEAEVAAALELLGEQLADLLEASDYADGCPVATVALECSSGPASVAQACRDVLREWVGVLAARLVEEGWEAEAAHRFSVTIVAAFEGALLMAKAERDTAPVRTVAAELAMRAAA